MRTVITYGTFDMFHIGHLRLLQKLKQMGEELIVAVSTDEFNAIKGKKVLIPFKDRCAIVESIRYVDKVIPETSWEQKERDIKAHAVDIFGIGEDWKGKFDHLSDLCEVVYLPRTPNVSSTELKKSLKHLLSISPDEIRMALDVLDTLRRDLE